MKKPIYHLLLPVLAAITVVAGTAMAEKQATPVKPAVQAGQDMEKLAPSRFGGHVHALAVNPQTKELFLGARPIYRSADNGKSWTAIDGIPKSEERANITSIAIDPTDPRVMYATGHGIGVVKSTVGGKTWGSATSGLGGMSTEGFVIDAKDPNTLYVGVRNRALPKQGCRRIMAARRRWTEEAGGPHTGLRRRADRNGGHLALRRSPARENFSGGNRSTR